MYIKKDQIASRKEPNATKGCPMFPSAMSYHDHATTRALIPNPQFQVPTRRNARTAFNAMPTMPCNPIIPRSVSFIYPHLHIKQRTEDDRKVDNIPSNNNHSNPFPNLTLLISVLFSDVPRTVFSTLTNNIPSVGMPFASSSLMKR